MSTTGLPDFDSEEYRFPENSSDITEQWDRTYSLLSNAQNIGLIDAPVRRLTHGIKPGDTADVIEPISALSEQNTVRIKVIGEQLWLLGYLENKPESQESSNIQSSQTFKNAVHRFQQEAGLIEDGWAGEQTWKALKTLVNFESKTEVVRWKRTDGVFQRAFRRAVQLRFWAYGLAEKKPGPEFNAIPVQNIKRFKTVLWSLGIIDDYNKKIPRTRLFSMLFNPDMLVKAAAEFKPFIKPLFGADESFSDGIHDLEEHEGTLIIKRRFLINLAKVELWLLGSDIKIDGLDDYEVKGLRKKSIFSRSDEGMRFYLEEYWKKLLPSETERKSTARAEKISPTLFKSFIAPDKLHHQGRQLKTFSEKDYSQQIARDFSNEPNTDELVTESYRVGKSIGMKLWDGLKRLWAWLKKGIKKILNFGKNIFRAFYRFAMKGFKIVKTGFTAFSKAMDQYIAGRIETEADSPVLIHLKKDMDCQIIIKPCDPPPDLSEAKKSVDRFSAMFFFSCEIINLFIDIVKGALSGLAGWARLLMALVKAYRNLIPAYRNLLLYL